MVTAYVLILAHFDIELLIFIIIKLKSISIAVANLHIFKADVV